VSSLREMSRHCIPSGPISRTAPGPARVRLRVSVMGRTLWSGASLSLYSLVPATPEDKVTQA
jgi:hypothetical protein